MTNKTRSLNYIRDKNGYRAGRTALYYFKVTNELNHDAGLCDDMLESEISKSIKELNKRYKLKFKIKAILSGLDGNDFVNNVFTVKFSLTAKH